MSVTLKRGSSKESSPAKNPSKARKSLHKTLIYHENSVQTVLTSTDIDSAFAGKAKDIRIDAVEKSDKDSQVDIQDKRIELLEEKIRKMLLEQSNLQVLLNERDRRIVNMEQQLGREREEKNAMKRELQKNTQRVLGMLEMVHATPSPMESEHCDSLLMLESQIQQSIKEKEFIEKESTELQDFLQDEKTAIAEALKEAEADIEQHQVQLQQRESDVERLQDECRHLVRVSEQRR